MDQTVPSWDLESVCPGGPAGDTFASRRAALAEDLAALQGRVEALPPLAEDPQGWVAVVRQLDPLEDAVTELTSFAGCAAAADSRSAAARRAEAAADELCRRMGAILVALTAELAAASAADFEAFAASEGLTPIVPWLRHVRAAGELRLDRALQGLKVAMDREALTGWGRLYDLLSGDLMGQLTVGGETSTVGVAELDALRAHPDPELRRAAHTASSEAWAGVAEICAHTLTQITGARQQFQDRVGIDELAESLHDNRLQAATLEAMWAGADAMRPALVRYLQAKARLLGTDRLDWWDRDAPLTSDPEGANLSWGQAADCIVRSFGEFHPDLAAFATRALDGRWIDAAPRDGRRPGGFCTDLPQSGQSRIFMTFTGTMDNALVLAHELGHAWHNHVLVDQPPFRREITSALAETASTFAEALVRDRVLASAPDDDFRAFMLDQELQAAVAFLMDIPARFAFERQLYASRREGSLAVDELSEAMVAAQRSAYGDGLGTYNPLFWCSKLHFYIPEFGFYNWPYTFGYLFSAAVYHRAKAAGPDFLSALQDLLRRTGWQSTEELAAEALGVDLTDPAFWIEAASPVAARVDAFLEATGDAKASSYSSTRAH